MSINVGERQAVSSVPNQKSGGVENVGTAFGIALQTNTFQKLFPFPVWLSAILNFGSPTSSTNVDQRRRTLGSVLGVKSKSDVVENVDGSRWNRVANNYR